MDEGLKREAIRPEGARTAGHGLYPTIMVAKFTAGVSHAQITYHKVTPA